MQLQFLGATDTVTGSKYVLDTGRHRVMVRLRVVPGIQDLAAAQLGSASA